MKQLIQALTAYTSTLEQQLAALEARVAQLEGQIEEQTVLIAALKAQPVAQPTPQLEEPEIEVELIMEDEAEEAAFEPETLEQIDQPGQLDTLEILEEIENTTELEPEIEPIIEEEPAPIEEPSPVVEEPIAEPAPVVEKTAPRPAPTQTSLFGSAVEDIRQAISLGDRFLFQRELFAGNGELMQKTLDELNGLGSFNEAMEYMTDHFEWDKDSTAVQLFENVLRRRFQ